MFCGFLPLVYAFLEQPTCNTYQTEKTVDNPAQMTGLNIKNQTYNPAQTGCVTIRILQFSPSILNEK